MGFLSLCWRHGELCDHTGLTPAVSCMLKCCNHKFVPQCFWSVKHADTCTRGARTQNVTFISSRIKLNTLLVQPANTAPGSWVAPWKHRLRHNHDFSFLADVKIPRCCIKKNINIQIAMLNKAHKPIWRLYSEHCRRFSWAALVLLMFSHMMPSSQRFDACTPSRVP